jgi:CRISPR-associated protein Cmr6
MPTKKLSFSDLGEYKSQLEKAPPPQKKAVAKKSSPSWQAPVGACVPLQVLKLDDFKIGQNTNQSPYKQVFEWQNILVAFLEIQNLNDRLEEVQDYFEATENREFQTILKRLRNDRIEWTNEAHQLAIQDEVGKLDDQRIRIVLEQTASADDSWQNLYTGLSQRTESLAGEVDDGTGNRIKAIVTAEFPWRVRVGGLQGFRERLLPVMHPIYGIPYVPSSSIKGLVRAWAREQKEPDIKHLLGYLEGSDSSMATVEFLDAFPTRPSLSSDVATPQWNWKKDLIAYAYGPAPHQLLSLQALELKIGLTHTSRGKEADVLRVMLWLEKALLANGLGSRSSAGYGVATKVNNHCYLPEVQAMNEKIYTFEIWSQGMYGSTPPARSNNHRRGIMEFRPSAVRGILRYWFRSIALGLYSPTDCKQLEQTLFGAIEPKPIAGSIEINVLIDQETTDNTHWISGNIRLKSKNSAHLRLIEKILQLASFLGGVGRGSRRPIHWNRGIGLRGCHWQLEGNSVLSPDPTDWHNFFKELKATFGNIMKFSSPGAGDPGTSKQRYQDVINRCCQIYIILDDDLKHPKLVNDWETEGIQDSVRGIALKILYEGGFKGKSRNGACNEKVGGQLQVPSYALIQSNYPQNATPYQAVTIFGANNRDRATFANAIKDKGGLKVWPLEP